VRLFRPRELIKGTSAKAVLERGDKKSNGFLFLGFYTIFNSPNFVGRVTSIFEFYFDKKS
jgi:hypothetical protein